MSKMEFYYNDNSTTDQCVQRKIFCISGYFCISISSRM